VPGRDEKIVVRLGKMARLEPSPDRDFHTGGRAGSLAAVKAGRSSCGGPANCRKPEFSKSIMSISPWTEHEADVQVLIPICGLTSTPRCPIVVCREDLL
jgi:hypothetical protein